jgi:hypothetical protein
VRADVGFASGCPKRTRKSPTKNRPLRWCHLRTRRPQPTTGVSSSSGLEASAARCCSRPAMHGLPIAIASPIYFRSTPERTGHFLPPCQSLGILASLDQSQTTVSFQPSAFQTFGELSLKACKDMVASLLRSSTPRQLWLKMHLPDAGRCCAHSQSSATERSRNPAF